MKNRLMNYNNDFNSCHILILMPILHIANRLSSLYRACHKGVFFVRYDMYVNALSRVM